MQQEPEIAAAVAVGSRRKGRRKPEFLPGESRRIGYLYVAPAFIIYAAFNLFQLGQGVNISFYEWDGLTPGTWVGLANYREFFTEPAIRETYIHVLELMVFYALAPIAIGLSLAVMLSRIRIRGLTFFRMLLFLPMVITDIVTAVAWTWIYATGGGVAGHPEGPLATVLKALGLGRLVPADGWLGNFHTALPAVGVFGMWGGFGFSLILFLAGIMKIPSSLYEAARVDGANVWHELRAVTLPGLRYELQVVLVLSVIGTLGTFDEIYVLTQGGPGTETSVPAWQIWSRLFNTGQVGSAAALGLIMMVIVFAVTYALNKLMERGASD